MSQILEAGLGIEPTRLGLSIEIEDDLREWDDGLENRDDWLPLYERCWEDPLLRYGVVVGLAYCAEDVQCDHFAVVLAEMGQLPDGERIGHDVVVAVPAVDAGEIEAASFDGALKIGAATAARETSASVRSPT